MQDLGIFVLEMVDELKLVEKTDVECCGVTPYQGFILMRLLENGPVSMQELSRRMRVAVSTMTRNIDKLEENGYVARTRSNIDARVLHVILTKKGGDTGDLIKHSWQAYFERVEANLGEQKKEVTQALSALLAAIRQAGSCCGD